MKIDHLTDALVLDRLDAFLSISEVHQSEN